MRRRYAALVVVAVLLVASIGIIATKGFHYVLGFTGGTVIEVRFAKPSDVDDVRDKLEKAGYASAQAHSAGAHHRTAQTVLTAVASAGNPATVLRNEFVGPQVGKELALNGVYAAVFMLVGFLVYIAFRFEWKFAVAASVTAVFDLLLTVA